MAFKEIIKDVFHNKNVVGFSPSTPTINTNIFDVYSILGKSIKNYKTSDILSDVQFIKHCSTSDSEYARFDCGNGNYLKVIPYSSNEFEVYFVNNNTSIFMGRGNRNSTDVTIFIYQNYLIIGTYYYWQSGGLYHMGGNQPCIYLISELAELGLKVENLSDEYGKMSATGGYSGGSFDDSSDTISLPNLPSIGYCSTGGHAYKLSQGELNSLVNEIFVDYTPIESGDTGLEKIGIMLENVALTMQQFLNSQFVQFVTDIHVIPVIPQTSNVTNIKLGARTLNTTSTEISSDYVEIDCGTLNIKEYYTNYLDFVGTSCKLYLPFIGFVDVKNEWFQNGLLNVTYHYNVIDGTFMTFIKSSSSKSNLSDSVVASYGGTCAVHLPFVGSDYSNVLSGIVSTVNGATTITGSKDFSSAIDSSINLLSNIGGTVNGSNNYNSNSAFLGIRTPYLYIERVVSSFSETYANENGLPTNVTFKLSELNGYTEVENIHIDNVNCTEVEKNELLSLLQNGIIL